MLKRINISSLIMYIVVRVSGFGQVMNINNILMASVSNYVNNCID